MLNYKPQKINYPTMGIPFEMVSNKVEQIKLEELTCPICQNLIWNIVYCSKCGNIFCQYSINQSIEKVNNSCPICRNSRFQISECLALKIFFKNIYLKCPNESCKENPNYLDYISHLEKCKFRKYYCSNQGCTYENVLNNEKDLIFHSQLCKFRIINCSYCNEKMNVNDYKNHVLYNCSQNMECPKCHKIMTRGIYNSVHNTKDNIEYLKAQAEYYKIKFQGKDNFDDNNKLTSCSESDRNKLKSKKRKINKKC